MIKIKYKGKEFGLKNSFFDLNYKDYELLINDRFEDIFNPETLEVIKKNPELLHFGEKDMKEFINSIEPMNVITVGEKCYFLDSVSDITFGSFLNCLESINNGNVYESVMAIILQMKHKDVHELDAFREGMEDDLKECSLYDIYCFGKFLQEIIEGQLNMERESIIYPVDIVKESLDLNSFFGGLGVWHDFQNYMNESGKNEREALLTRYKYIYLWKSVKCAEANFSHAYKNRSQELKK